MLQRPPRASPTDTPVPYTTVFRSPRPVFRQYSSLPYVLLLRRRSLFHFASEHTLKKRGLDDVSAMLGCSDRMAVAHRLKSMLFGPSRAHRGKLRLNWQHQLGPVPGRLTGYIFIMCLPIILQTRQTHILADFPKK